VDCVSPGSEFFSAPAAAAIADAVAAAKAADVTVCRVYENPHGGSVLFNAFSRLRQVLALGLGAAMESEGGDRVNMTLPSNQQALLAQVRRARCTLPRRCPSSCFVWTMAAPPMATVRCVWSYRDHSFRELDWKTLIFFERVILIAPETHGRSPRWPRS
jgi:hypothetical protein